MSNNEPTIELHPTRDGVDHINVYTRGITALGRSLSNLADIEVNHPKHGRFRTLEGLYFWRATGMKHEQLRGSNGYDARKHGSKLDKVWDNGFQLDIKIGLAAKIIMNNDLYRLLSNFSTDLPFHHYYYYGKGDNVKLVVPRGHDWQMDAITLIRKTIMERQELHGKGMDPRVRLGDLLTDEFWSQQ